jgi:hypothetical protein
VIFDATGRSVRTLIAAELPGGSYSPVWDGRGDAGGELPSGVYFARVDAGGRVETVRVVVAR